MRGGGEVIGGPRGYIVLQTVCYRNFLTGSVGKLTPGPGMNSAVVQSNRCSVFDKTRVRGCRSINAEERRGTTEIARNSVVADPSRLPRISSRGRAEDGCREHETSCAGARQQRWPVAGRIMRFQAYF